MPQRRLVVSILLGAAMLPGCMRSTPGDDTQGASTSTSATTSGNPSGSVTSATDGGSDSAPTMGTAGISGTSDDTASSGVPCNLICDDYPKNECDQWAQDCPEGQKCAAVITDGGGAWNDVACVDVTGMDKPGDTCIAEDVASGVDSCIEGAMCWEVDMEGVGYCAALCTGDPETPVCENEGACWLSGSGVVNLCFPDCDPLLQDCPEPAGVCYPIGNGFACAPDASGDAGQANDPCEFINVCDPGLMCADTALVGMGCPPGFMGCCTPFCNFPGGPCPNPDQQCVQYFDPMQLPPNDPSLNIGFCGVPA